MVLLQAVVYRHLQHLQGTAIPQLVAAGQLGWPDNDTITFVAPRHEGANALQVPLVPEDVTRALQCLQQIHDAGVLHQDLHPGNILINTEVGLCSSEKQHLSPMLTSDP